VPLVVYSLLRLVLFGACWWLLAWVGLNPWLAVVVAAFLAWGLSYVALPGPRDAAARWLAARDAERKARGGRPHLSARAQQDAADEDAQVDAASDDAEHDEATSDDAAADETLSDDAASDDAALTDAPHDEGDGRGQSASPSPSSTP
jgi:hypothetical protein